jgi:hypothetical protein
VYRAGHTLARANGPNDGPNAASQECAVEGERILKRKGHRAFGLVRVVGLVKLVEIVICLAGSNGTMPGPRW